MKEYLKCYCLECAVGHTGLPNGAVSTMRQNGTCPLEHSQGFEGNLHHTEMFSLLGGMMANVEQAASLLKVEIFYSKGGGSFIQNLSTCVTNL